jgi:HEAT repeat protein
VVTRALELFAASGRTDFVAMADRLLGHPDSGVRATSLRVLSAIRPEDRVLQKALSDPASEVRTTAGVSLLASGRATDDSVRTSLEEVTREGSGEARLALGKSIRLNPAPVFEGLLRDLLLDGDLDVRLEAIRAIREARNPAFLEPLVSLLAERSLREEVRGALVSFGPIALSRLEEALGDPALPHGVRRHLPQTIGEFGSVQASRILLERLLTERDGMVRFKILRALGRWRNKQPHLPLDTPILERSLHQTLSAGFRFMSWRRDMEAGIRQVPARATETHGVLVLLLRDKQDHALERLFRLLNLYTNNDEYRGIFRGLHSPRKESKAGSRELLDHLLFSPLRRPLLTLVDDLLEPPESFSGDDPDREDHRPYEAVLLELLGSGVESLSSLAAAQIGSLGLIHLAPALYGCSSLSDAHREVLESSRESLKLQGAGV